MGNMKSNIKNNNSIKNNKSEEIIKNEAIELKKIKKIIIVDDVIIMSEIMKEYLTLKGYDTEIICLSSGKDCLDALEDNNDVDIIFMDLIMCPMDGYETAERILEKYKIKIVALSGMVENESRNRCKNIGFEDVIQKPVDYEKLIKKVNNWGFEFIKKD